MLLAARFNFFYELRLRSGFDLLARLVLLKSSLCIDRDCLFLVLLASFYLIESDYFIMSSFRMFLTAAFFY